MSPILVRPVREQLEHDRIIRQLQNKFRRKFEVAVNPGNEKNAAAGPGLHPDLVLLGQEKGRRPQVVIEVETGESVNHLEALAQWSNFARLRPAFHLYVPSGMVEVARRLCSDNHIAVNEIWAYHGIGDDVRFALVHRARDGAAAKREARSGRTSPRSAGRAGRKAARPKRPVVGARSASRSKARSSAASKKRVRGQKRR